MRVGAVSMGYGPLFSGCPDGARHTSPGQRPGIKNLGHFGVLKERCRRVDLPTGIGAMRRSFRTRPVPDAYSQGFTLGWYALPRWGKGGTRGSIDRVPLGSRGGT
jgi:hypothetical protein